MKFGNKNPRCLASLIVPRDYEKENSICCNIRYHRHISVFAPSLVGDYFLSDLELHTHED